MNVPRWTRNLIVAVLWCLAIAASVLTLVYFGLRLQWNREAKRDGAAFDALITSGDIDRVELVIYEFNRGLDETNIFTGSGAQRFIRVFAATNRTSKPDVSKAQVTRHITLMKGTNVLDWLTQFDNGLWKFRDYSFVTKTAP